MRSSGSGPTASDTAAVQEAIATSYGAVSSLREAMIVSQHMSAPAPPIVERFEALKVEDTVREVQVDIQDVVGEPEEEIPAPLTPEEAKENPMKVRHLHLIYGIGLH
jgi:hypothetical protein